MGLTEPALFFTVTEMLLTQFMLEPELTVPVAPLTISAPLATHPDACGESVAANVAGLKSTINAIVSTLVRTNPKTFVFVNIRDSSFLHEKIYACFTSLYS